MMIRSRSALRAVTDLVLRTPSMEAAALRRAARRQRRLTLIWHRIGPVPRSPHEVVRTVPLMDFEAQLDVLEDLGDVVPLAAMGDPAPSDRPRFALTFDDDDRGHARHVLAVLVSRGLPATFFLSGRWLHGRGRYWWEVLEEEIARDGRAAVADRYALPSGLSASRMAQALTGTSAAATMAGSEQVSTTPPMDQADASALVAAGMEVGFHTIDHDVLPTLDDRQLQRAVRDGRAALAEALATHIERFAYPYGKADGRVAAAALSAGYRSAWTTTKRLDHERHSTMLRGRYDISGLPAAQARARLVRALVGPSA